MTSLTLSALAELCGARLVGDGSRAVKGPAPLADAGPDEISFLGDRRYLGQLATTRAGAVLVADGLEIEREDLALLRCEHPGRAFTRVVLAFSPAPTPPAPGIHPTAVVEASAEIASDASVGALCSVGAHARIAPGVVLGPGVTLGEHVELGRDTCVHASAVLYPYVRVGQRCIIHSGAVLGADGFGFEPSEDGWQKTPQAGIVVLEDDVEVGANSTIDCARFGATHIGRGVKIDNLVHLGHNVKVGEYAMFMAQVGVGGSTRIGKRAILAGQAGVLGHVEIGDGARLAAGSGAFKDIPAGAEVIGYPAGPKLETLRTWRELARLRDLRCQVKELGARLARIESGGDGAVGGPDGAGEGEGP